MSRPAGEASLARHRRSKGRLATAVLCGIALGSLTPSARSQEGGYTVIGAPGLLTCDRWLVISDDDSLRVRDDDDVAEQQVKAWVGGFLSAYNRYVLEQGNVAADRDPAELITWADRFCEANPEATMATLAETMIIELNAARR